MAGEFSKAVRPRLAGAYFNWQTEASIDSPPASIGSIVAVPVTHNWGPLQTFVALDSFDEWKGIFGVSNTAGMRAVYGAFKGEGLPGKGGAGRVLVYRMGTGAAAASTLNLSNGAATGIRLDARYKGTRGNVLAATVQAGAVVGTKELLLLDGGRVIERYPHNSTDLAGLVATINATSDFVTGTVVNAGVALANVASAALAGGADGDVLTATEHTDAQTKLASVRFSLLAPQALTDPTIRASYVAWTQGQNTVGKRHLLIVGGAAGESVATGVLRSQSFNDWDVVNLAGPALHDDVLGVDMSTAELASRVAGAIANRGERKDLIYARFTDLSVPAGVVLPTLAEQEQAVIGGATVFSIDTNEAAPVFIREGVTTYADDTASPRDEDGNKIRTVEHYSRIKNLRIQHGIETELDEWATSGDVLGSLPVNDRVRALVLGRVTEAYASRETAEIVQAGWTVQLDTDPPPDDDQDFVQYVHGFHPTRSLRQMFNTARIG
jgi:hypothetical protein